MYEYINTAEIGDNILIPPTEIGDILAFEYKKCPRVIDYMVKALQWGEEFPPVPVLILQNSIIALSLNTRIENGKKVDGGHHRALAYYLADKSMPVTIVEKPNELDSLYLEVWKDGLTIKDILLVDDPYSHLHRMDINKEYRLTVQRIEGIENPTLDWCNKPDENL